MLCASVLVASFFEPIIVVVAVRGVRAAGIAVACCCVDEFDVLVDDEATVARLYASDYIKRNNIIIIIITIQTTLKQTILTIVSDQLLNKRPDERFSNGMNGSYCLKNVVIMRTYINIDATHR